MGATVDRICQLSIRFLSQQQQQQSLMFTFGSTDASSAELFHVDQVLQRLTQLRILAHGDDGDDGDDDMMKTNTQVQFLYFIILSAVYV